MDVNRSLPDRFILANSLDITRIIDNDTRDHSPIEIPEMVEMDWEVTRRRIVVTTGRHEASIDKP